MSFSKIALFTLCLSSPALVSANALLDNHGHHKDKHAAKEAQHVQQAVAIVQPTDGNQTSGVVTFMKVDDGIKVTGRIENLTPGMHGFHVHQFGDLSKSDGTSAGGHFNPKGMSHGSPDDNKRHIGDLGNIEADENGVAEFSFVDKKLSFKGAHSILGRGLIIHAGKDDLTSQPTGAAGARVGMAVIGVANPTI